MLGESGGSLQVERLAVLAGHQWMVTDGRSRHRDSVDQINDAGMQRPGSGPLEFTHGHVEPVGVTDENDGVGGSPRFTPRPAGVRRRNSTHEHPVVGLCRAEQFRGGRALSTPWL